MKKWMKSMQVLASVVTISTAVVASPMMTQAAESGIDTTVIDEKWGKPTFVYGGGLNDTQVAETAELLGIENIGNVAAIPVTGDDLERYLNEGDTATSEMISSVLVQKENSGEGVDVVVNTPNNIVEITEDQYANAAITAGVNDATIVVASVSRVTGESALTGIYKAFDANGEDLDQDRMVVAQEELETTNAIAQENAEKQGFDASNLDQALIDIKQGLADLKDQQGQLATREDIERIINEALARYNLEDIVTQEQFDRLLSLFEKYQQTGAIDSQQVKEQLNNLSDTVKDKLSGVIQRAEDSGLLDRVGSFFRDIWQAIVNLFN